jgi:hypothetical protein
LPISAPNDGEDIAVDVMFVLIDWPSSIYPALLIGDKL